MPRRIPSLPNCLASEQAENGYLLPVILLLIAASTLVVVANLRLLGGSEQLAERTTLETKRFYASESALNIVAAWLRENSAQLESVYTQPAKDTLFSKTVSSKGTNDPKFPTATRIKLADTNYSVLLTNNSLLGISNFPTSRLESGRRYYPAIEFNTLQLDGVSVKVTLVDLLEESSEKSKSISTEQTKISRFLPVYRIDAVQDFEADSHVYGYFLGTRGEALQPRFFGAQYVGMHRDCDSYSARTAEFSRGRRNTACKIESLGEICIGSNTQVFGEVSTKGVVDSSDSCQGTVCSDFNCLTPGASCAGVKCNVLNIPRYRKWSDYCPSTSEQPAVKVESGERLELRTSSDGVNCWSSVAVAEGGELVLSSSGQPYFFKTLALGAITPKTMNDGSLVNIFVKEIVGDVIKGLQLKKAPSDVSVVQLHYLGSRSLTILSNSEVRLSLFSPNAEVRVTGDKDYFGSIYAHSLRVDGVSAMHLDESVTIQPVPSIKYRLMRVGQYYR